MGRFLSLDQKKLHPRNIPALWCSGLCPSLKQLLRNSQVAVVQAVAKVDSLPCRERSAFAEQHGVGKEKMFFLLRLTLEYFQTRRVLHRIIMH